MFLANLYRNGCEHGAFLLSGGTKGKRFALPNAEIVRFTSLPAVQGQATEINIVAEHILKHAVN